VRLFLNYESSLSHQQSTVCCHEISLFKKKFSEKLILLLFANFKQKKMDDPIGYDFSVPGMNTLKSFYYNGCSLIELQTLIINQKLNTYFNNLYLSRVCKLRRLKSYSKELQFNFRDTTVSFRDLDLR
jgi:hypothetical protein